MCLNCWCVNLTNRKFHLSKLMTPVPSERKHEMELKGQLIYIIDQNYIQNGPYYIHIGPYYIHIGPDYIHIGPEYINIGLSQINFGPGHYILGQFIYQANINFMRQHSVTYVDWKLKCDEAYLN